PVSPFGITEWQNLTGFVYRNCATAHVHSAKPVLEVCPPNELWCYHHFTTVIDVAILPVLNYDKRVFRRGMLLCCGAWLKNDYRCKSKPNRCGFHGNTLRRIMTKFHDA